MKDDEVEVLYCCACDLDRNRSAATAAAEEEAKRLAKLASKFGASDGDRPGDLFNRRGTWDEVLAGAGWKVFRTRGDTIYWTRPGKEGGVSASTGHCSSSIGGDLLYVFSSNAEPLQEGRCYSKFRAYALLRHNGDHSAAAKALRQLGYAAERSSRRGGRGPADGGADPDERNERNEQEHADAEALAALLEQAQADIGQGIRLAVSECAVLARLKASRPDVLQSIYLEMAKLGATSRDLSCLEKAVNAMFKQLAGAAKRRQGEEQRQRRQDATREAGDSPDSPASPYFVSGNRTWRKKLKRDGIVSQPLANFVARIVEEVTMDLGGEVEHHFTLTGTLHNGEPLPAARINAADFPSLNWVVKHWGSRAIPNAGLGAKEHLRAAMQEMSDPERRLVYRHTGWRQLGEKWVYLSGGGGIGKDGLDSSIAVELDGRLAQVLLAGAADRERPAGGNPREHGAAWAGAGPCPLPLAGRHLPLCAWAGGPLHPSDGPVRGLQVRVAGIDPATLRIGPGSASSARELGKHGHGAAKPLPPGQGHARDHR